MSQRITGIRAGNRFVAQQSGAGSVSNVRAGGSANIHQAPGGTVEDVVADGGVTVQGSYFAGAAGSAGGSGGADASWCTRIFRNVFGEGRGEAASGQRKVAGGKRRSDEKRRPVVTASVSGVRAGGSVVIKQRVGVSHLRAQRAASRSGDSGVSAAGHSARSRRESDRRVHRVRQTGDSVNLSNRSYEGSVEIRQQGRRVEVSRVTTTGDFVFHQSN